MGAACNSEGYGACDGYSCNTTADPCEAGSKCTNGKCVATNGRSQLADALTGGSQSNAENSSGVVEEEKVVPSENEPQFDDVGRSDTQASEDSTDTESPSVEPSEDESAELWSSAWL